MNVKIYSKTLQGSICAPSSPSYAVKVITAAALAETSTRLRINNVPPSVRAVLDSVRSLGAMAWEEKDEIEILPSRRGLSGCFIDARESEEALGIMLPVVSALYGYGEFTGEVTSSLIPVLNSHGCRVSAERPPFIIQGKLQAGRYVMPKDTDAYAVSGLLLALPLVPEESEIILTDRLQNREYVSETIEVLSRFGIEILEYDNRFVIPKKCKYTSPSKIKIDGDFESSACWLAANALGCRIEISGMRTDTKNAIAQIIDDIKHGGAVNAVQFPHLAPLFAACAAVGKNKCRIVTGDIGDKKTAESAAALSSLGIRIVPNPDGFTVTGANAQCGGVCSSYGSPYIVMAAAAFSAACGSDVEIYGADAVNKIYPSFFEVFKSIGAEFKYYS